MKNKIRIKTDKGREIVFGHSSKELYTIDATREVIFLWDGGHIKIFTVPGQDAVFYAMEADRLIAWTYADEQEGGES